MLDLRTACRVPVAALLAVAALWLAQLPAGACKGHPDWSVPEQVRHADAVFSGAVIEAEDANDTAGGGGMVSYRVQIDRLYKGDLSEPVVRVESPSSFAACGLPPLPVGARYMFFVTESSDALVTTVDSGTTRATSTLTMKVREAVGSQGQSVGGTDQTAPVTYTTLDSTAPPSLNRLVAPGAGLAVLGALGLFFVRRVAGSR